MATIVVAFSPLLRASVLSLSKFLFTFVVVYSGLYRIWIAFHDEWSSQHLMRKTELKVRKMKEEVRKAKRKRAARRAELLGDGNEPDAKGVSETSRFSWLGKIFWTGNTPSPDGQPTSPSGSIWNDKPEVRETTEQREQSARGPPSTTSGVTTQVNTNPRMLGGNTPVSYGANTPNPGLTGGEDDDRSIVEQQEDYIY